MFLYVSVHTREKVSHLMSKDTISSVNKIPFSIVLEGTEDLENGSGPIHRHGDSRNGLEKSYSPDVNTLYDNFIYAYKLDPEANFIGWRPIVEGKAQPYTFWTYEEGKRKIEAYSRSLVKYGLLSETQGYEKRVDGKPIYTIGHFMKNSRFLIISQFATWRLNGTVVPLYDTLGMEAIAHICNESELKTVLCSPASAALVLHNVKEVPEKYGSLKNLVIADGEITEELKNQATELHITLFSFDSLLEEGESLPDPTLPTVDGDDLCMICYTSGTTGVPKGALLSHINLVSVGTVCKDYIRELADLGKNDYYISYLPMGHAFEHFMQTSCIALGMGIGFSQGDTRKIVDDFKELKPSVFASVPRVLERLIDKVKEAINEQSWLVRTMFRIAFSQKKKTIMKSNTNKCPFWDNHVFKSVLEKIGLQNVRAMVTGSAPITQESHMFLRVLFLTNVLQGLGATETSGGACVTLPCDFNTFNHCGSPIKAMEAKLVSVPDKNYLVTDKYHGRVVDKNGKVLNEGIPCDGRGEVCFRGYNVIKGYYRLPSVNELTFDKDGWYHSGDIAIWNEYGGLQIVDRKKDIFKLSQGEYISPDKVTGVYQACSLVANLFVYGDSYKSFLVAVVVPSEYHLRKVLDARNIENKDISFVELCKKPEVKAVVFEEMAKVGNNSELVGFEKIKNIYLDHENWSVDNGMLTPTMKLKRQASLTKYMDAINLMYEEGIYTLPSNYSCLFYTYPRFLFILHTSFYYLIEWNVDKKQVIVIASAVTALSAAALILLSKKKNGKKSSKRTENKNKSSEKTTTSESPVVGKEQETESDEVDFTLATTPELVMNMALNYLTAKNYAKAVKCYSKGLKMVGTKDLAKRRLMFVSRAQAYVKLNQMDKAISDFTESIKLFPLDPSGYYERGNLYVSIGQDEKALHDFTMYTLLITDYNKIPESLTTLTTKLQKSIGIQLASVEMERRKKDPSYVAPFPPNSHFNPFFGYFKSEKKDEYNVKNFNLIELTNKINHYNPEEEREYTLGDYYLMRAGLLKKACYYKEAMNDFEKATIEENKCNDMFSAKLEYATFLTLLNKLEDSIPIYEELLKNGSTMSKDPNWVNLYAKYITALANIKPQEAVTLADKAVALYPDERDIHIARGSVAYQTKNLIQAIDEFTKSIEIEPNVCAYMYLTMCYGESELDRALEIVKKAVELEPTNADVLNAYGDMSMMKGHYLKAEGIYDDAIESNPSDPKGYINKATLYMRFSQDAKKAEELLKKAIEKDSCSVEAYLALIQLYTVLKKNEAVQEMIKKGLEFAYSFDDVAEILGYKHVIEESIKCEKYVKELKESTH